MPILLAQVVLAFATGGGPVRLGAPVPVRALEVGLTLRGPGALQWRPLPLAVRGGQCWVEIAVVGTGSRAQIHLGGADATPAGDGGAVMATAQRDDDGETVQWCWRDGTVDWRRRRAFTAATILGGEEFASGEFLTEESPGCAEHASALLSLPRRHWTQIGLLPADEGLGRVLRRHLQDVGHALQELPGRRGAGDYARSGGVVTNLEFDATLALLRLALAQRDEDLLLRARRAAFHLVDRDLDAATGLPFAHGNGHRDGAPAPGHVWLQGVLWTGVLLAEPVLLSAAGQIARALAAAPPMGEGPEERARDYGWPLLELEAWLAFADDTVVAAAADRLALAIAQHFDDRTRTFRFGEGEVRGPGDLERGWLTGGIVVPALQAHLRRRPSPQLQAIVDAAVAALLDRIGQGRGGLPTHWRVLPGASFAEHRAQQDPKAFLLLEALPRRELRRLLGKEEVAAALLGTPPLDAPDLATDFAIAARCAWVYR